MKTKLLKKIRKRFFIEKDRGDNEYSIFDRNRREYYKIRGTVSFFHHILNDLYPSIISYRLLDKYEDRIFKRCARQLAHKIGLTRITK